MRVYRDVVRETTTAAAIERVRRHAWRRAELDLVVEMGELEQAALDSRESVADHWDGSAARLRDASLAAGRAYVAGLAGSTGGDHIARFMSLLDVIERDGLTPALRVRAPEGYAHYGLDPAAYAAAAIAYARDRGAALAASAVVLGVRSIGTSLSAVVAAAIDSAKTVTVRPRGPTGRRRIIAATSQCDRMLELLEGASDVLIVDEGPGATGETFACVGAWLCGLGVPESAIVLFASRAEGMPLAPAARRAWFATMRKYLAAEPDDRPARIANSLGWSEPEDLSAGRWRRVLSNASMLPSRTGFERAKFRSRDMRGQFWQLRYAGLGCWRDDLLARANTLSELGLAPPLQSCADGFVRVPWIRGRPLARADTADPLVMRSVGRYLRGRAGRFGTGRTVDVGEVVAWLGENAAELPASLQPEIDGARRALEKLPDREAVFPDARLQPWEWLRTARDVVKVDSVDHADGFRMPGPTDSAWDIAAVDIEFGLHPHALDSIVRECARAIRQPEAELTDAVRAYRTVYAAIACADARLSAIEAASPWDRRRWLDEAEFYVRSLGGPASAAG